MATEFDPDEYLKGATATAEFDPDEYLSARVSPEKKGQQTLQSISRGEAPLPASGQELLEKTGPYYRSSALGRDAKAIGEGLFGGPGVLRNISDGLGGLAFGAYQGVNNAGEELKEGFNSDIQGQREAEAQRPTLLGQYLPQGVMDTLAVINGNTLPSIPASIAAAGATGAYKAVAPLVKAGAKIGSDIGLDATRAAAWAAGSQDLADAAALSEAQRDRARLAVERGVEAPVMQTVTEGSGLPAVTEAASNVVPLAIPVGGGIEASGFAQRIGSAVERGNPAAYVAGKTIQGAGTAVDEIARHRGLAGVATAAGKIASGNVGEGLLEGAVVPLALRVARPYAQSAAQFGEDLAQTGATAQSRALGQIAGAGLNTAAATGTGLLYGLGGAEPGDEVEGVRSGAAMGLALSPLAVIGGSFTRQKLEQAAESAKLAKIGEPNVIGAENLSPDNAQTVKAIQGLITGLDTTQGNRVKTIVQTPEEFARGAAVVNDGQVDTQAAATARGYYNDADGNIVLNAGHDDLIGAMHEATHAASDILPGIDPSAARELNASLQRAAVDSSGEPTQGFQRFLDAYQGRKVDWSKLPDDGGESKAYYLREFGAQTGLALKNLAGGGLENPGQYSLRPEASDLVFNALGDWARRTGIKASPDVSEALPGQTAQPIPADPQSLAQTRGMLYRVGQAPKGESPAVTTEVAPATPVAASPVSAPVLETVAENPARNTDAYQTAQTLLTLPKTRFGQGMDAETAQARLDAAAANPDVPNTVEDYLFYSQTGRPRAAQDVTARPAATETVAPQATSPVVAESSTSRPTAVLAEPVVAPQQARQATPEPETLAPSRQADAVGPTADDLSSIRQRVAADFTPEPYNPRGTLAEREQKKQSKAAKDLADAQFNAAWEAHKPTADAGAVQLKVDPETGKQTVSGQYFRENDALHNEVLSRLDDETRQNLSAVQQSIASGAPAPLNIDYFSADPLRTQKTGAQRQESQAASPAAPRAIGEAPGFKADKEFYPLSLSVTKDGNVMAFGFSPDKLIGNADKVLSYFTDNNIKFPYSDVNDPQFVADVSGYAANHANGFKGDGRAPLVASKAISVQSTEGYQPYVLDKQRADAINLIMANEGAKPPSKGYDQVPSSRLREFAKLNGITPSEAGEVNALRQQINDAQNFKSGPDVGTKKVLESPFENIRLDLITRLKPSDGAPPEFTNLRAQAFRGNRGDLVRNGLPSAKIAGAGFLPASKAGVPTGKEADAAQLWKNQGVESPYFQDWFKGSRVTDGDGNPLVVYHGTDASFDIFDRAKSGKGPSKLGFWFTNLPDFAENFGGKTMPAYVTLKNPKRLTAAQWDGIREQNGGNAEYFSSMREDLIAQGFDGIAVPGGIEKVGRFEINTPAVYAAFHPEQIKSATGNQGTFDPANPNINFLPSGNNALGPNKLGSFGMGFFPSNVIDEKTDG